MPLVVKISPDVTTEELHEMAEVFLTQKIDGIIATNTSLARDNVPDIHEQGSLSGRPLAQRSTRIIQQLHEILQDRIPIIGSGGVFSAEDAAEKFAAGAKLLQIYTSLIYQGPKMIADLVG